ncbi:hypothetical protein HID58_069455, partial [Brassica napus]
VCTQRSWKRPYGVGLLEKTLKSSLCTVSVLGVDEPFHLLDQESIQNVIDTFEKVPEEEEDAGEGEADPEAAAAYKQNVLGYNLFRVIKMLHQWKREQ